MKKYAFNLQRKTTLVCVNEVKIKWEIIIIHFTFNLLASISLMKLIASQRVIVYRSFQSNVVAEWIKPSEAQSQIKGPNLGLR